MLLSEKDGTSGLVREVFDDSDKVGGDVVLLRGCPQSCMPNPVEGLSVKTWQRSCWCWSHFSHRMRRLKDLLCGTPSCSEACLFFGDDLLRLRFSLFAMIFSMILLGWLMRLIVRQFWHCCRLPFLGSVMTKDWIQGAGHFPVCQILSQIVVKAVITSYPPAWTRPAGMLSTPTHFPFFSECTAA